MSFDGKPKPPMESSFIRKCLRCSGEFLAYGNSRLCDCCNEENRKVAKRAPGSSSMHLHEYKPFQNLL